MERGGEVHPPRPTANPTPSRSQGNLTCHTTGGLLDLSEGNPGPVPWGIPTKEATQPATMQAPTERRSYPGHLVLADEPFAEVGGTTMLEEDQCGVATITHQPAGHPEAWSRSHERSSPHDEALQEASEAHQWALEAACILELDIKRLSQEAENILHWCPCSLSGSCLQSRSLNRQERSLGWCRPERHVTFCDPEVELISGEGPYGDFTQAQTERGEVGHLPT